MATQRPLVCRDCEMEGRRNVAVGVGRGGEPACRRHARVRTMPRTRSAILRRITRSDRRARAAHLAFLGDVRRALASGAVSRADVGAALGASKTTADKYARRADEAGAL